MGLLQFLSPVYAIAERRLNTKDVESAERLARTPTRQLLMNGTRTGNQTTRQLNTLPDTSRDTSNHSRLLLSARVYPTHRVCRRRCPPWNKADGEGRRIANTATEDGIQGPRIVLQKLLR